MSRFGTGRTGIADRNILCAPLGDGVKARRGPGQEVYNERIYTVVWLNNLQPAEMELVSRCN